MKNSLLILVIVSTAINLQGQSLTFSNVGYVSGDFIRSFAVDSTAVNTSNNGTSATWSFPNVPITQSSQSSTIMNPATTPYFSSFPTANVASLVSSGQYVYYISNANELTMLGFYDAGSLVIYSDPQIYFIYPMSYGSSFTDNIASDYYVNTTLFQRTGNVQALVDATGTLEINGQTFNNVLRLKYTQNITEVSVYGTTHQNLISYIWFDCVHKTPLLNIYYIDIIGDYYFSSSKTALIADFLNDIDYTYIADNPDFNIYPNPIYSGTNLVIHNTNSSRINMLNYEIMDITGRMVKKGVIENVSAENTLCTNDLSKGIYFLKLNNSTNSSSQKFVIE